MNEDKVFLKPGPVKWCNTCGGKHPARLCDLEEVERTAKSGRKVTRLTRLELADRG